jgi:mono/diheme cytochrome c family protein
MKILAWIIVALVAIQIVPYGHTHLNPPENGEPKWDSPQTEKLFQRACFDCHSNRTAWPWYAHVAPISWLLARDVNGGRQHLNFSEWSQPQKHAKDIAREVQSGDMPPWFYLPMHPAAKLSDAEKQEITDGAWKTFGTQEAPR